MPLTRGALLAVVWATRSRQREAGTHTTSRAEDLSSTDRTARRRGVRERGERERERGTRCASLKNNPAAASSGEGEIETRILIRNQREKGATKYYQGRQNDSDFAERNFGGQHRKELEKRKTNKYQNVTHGNPSQVTHCGPHGVEARGREQGRQWEAGHYTTISREEWGRGREGEVNCPVENMRRILA